MKKVIFFITILVFFSKIGNAQTSVYHPMLNEPYWYMRVADLSGNSYYSYTTIGDTLIGNQGYKKIELNVPNNSFDTIYYLREDIANKTVFRWNGSTDILLYDFNLTVGSTYYLFTGNACSGFVSFQVDYIDSVLLGFGYTKRFLLTTTNQPFPMSIYFVEGVGSLEEPIFVFSCTVDPSYSIDCFSQNGVQIYGNNCSQMPPPNSVHNNEVNETAAYWISTSGNQFTLHTNQSNQTPVKIDVLDLSGRLITQINNVSPNDSQNLSLQSAGMYLITITHSTGFQTTQKLFLSN
jgi:Secretion system C-terminal sorting domain